MKFPKFSRNQWVFLVLLLILGGQIARYIWANWGLITVHSKGQSLSQVIRSIEKQGHVTIKTNMDLTKPVDMFVDRVPIAEALETLATVTESRWRLAYYLGPDKSSLSAALSTFTSGQKAEGWQALFVPLPPIGTEPEVIPDPRKDLWAVKPVADATLQGYLKEAAKNVSATFFVPETFNPPVKSPPRAGAINASLPKLASAAKAKYEEVFILQGSTRPADDRRGDDGEFRFAGNFGDRGRGFDRDAMEERIQNEINKLPSDQRTAAQQEHDERKRFFDSLKDMTPEQRKAAFEQLMSDPNMQDKMDNANTNRDARRTPQQRIARAAAYLQRRASLK